MDAKIIGLLLAAALTAPACSEKAKEPASQPATQTQAAAADPKPAAQADPKAADTQLYTCPMHPNVVHQGPGKCPECEMNLIPKK